MATGTPPPGSGIPQAEWSDNKKWPEHSAKAYKKLYLDLQAVKNRTSAPGEAQVRVGDGGFSIDGGMSDELTTTSRQVNEIIKSFRQLAQQLTKGPIGD